MQAKSLLEALKERTMPQIDFKSIEDVFEQELRKQENIYVSLNKQTPLAKFDNYPKQDHRETQGTKKLRNAVNIPWLNKGNFLIQEIAIKDYMYLYALQAVKINSVMIVNSLGHIIFANKLASEHFQGSLNSFATNSFQQFVIKSQKEEFMRLINKFMGRRVWVNYLTYSKSSKRKYALYPQVKEVTFQDIYFRYLKMLKSRVSPLRINFKHRQNIDGFWNDSLISKDGSQLCFVVQSRYGQRLPPRIDLEVLLKDEGIVKFLGNTQKKKNAKDEDQATVANPRHIYQKSRKNEHQAVKQREKMLREMFKAKKRELDLIRDKAVKYKRGELSANQPDNQSDGQSDQYSDQVQDDCDGEYEQAVDRQSQGPQENVGNINVRPAQNITYLDIWLREYDQFPIEEDTPWHTENYHGLFLHTDDPNRQIEDQNNNLQGNMQEQSLISNDFFGSVYHGDLVDNSSNIDSQCSLFRDPMEINEQLQMGDQCPENNGMEIQIGQYLVDFNQ